MAKINLASQTASATIETRGASLISLEVNKTELVGKPAKPGIETFHGSTLSPWQNRLENGLWQGPTGTSYQNPINEPERGNALHGLLFDKEFEVEKVSESKANFSFDFVGTDGFPFSYQLVVSYQLEDSGIKCSFEVTNLSSEAMPFVIGFHPYLCIGQEVANLTLTAPAKTHYSQNKHKIPVAKESVAGTRFDLSQGIKVSEAGLDDYFTDLEFVAGIATTTLTDEKFRTLEIWQDEAFQHLVIYTTNQYPGADGVISAVAIEPVSAPANALATGDHPWLEPAAMATGSWGIRLTEK